MSEKATGEAYGVVRDATINDPNLTNAERIAVLTTVLFEVQQAVYRAISPKLELQK